MASRSISIYVFLLFAVSLIYGLSLDEVRAKRELDEPTEEDCMKPPMIGRGHECCRVPKERIWGDLRSSIHKCLKQYKPGYKPMSQEVTEDVGEQAVTPMNGANESAGTSPRPSDSSDGHRGQHGRPMKKTHRLPRHQNDSCFMECVFEEQGFLNREEGCLCTVLIPQNEQDQIGDRYLCIQFASRKFRGPLRSFKPTEASNFIFIESDWACTPSSLMNKLVNKFALIGRLNRTLEKNQQWHKVAVTAVETCSQMDLKIDTNTTCQSGSEEIFRCIFKHLFFNCPSWSQNEYCTSLKKFYEKCPNGPPPVMNDSHPTSVPEEMETLSTTESEKYFE